MYQQSFQRVINPQNIQNLMRTESSDILTIDYLSVLAKTEQERYLWRQVLTSRKQHYESIRSLYRFMTGSEPAVNQEVFQRPESYQIGLQSQNERFQNRLQQLQHLIQQAVDSNIVQFLEVIIGQFQYEGLLLRQIGRFQ